MLRLPCTPAPAKQASLDISGPRSYNQYCFVLLCSLRFRATLSATAKLPTCILPPTSMQPRHARAGKSQVQPTDWEPWEPWRPTTSTASCYFATWASDLPYRQLQSYLVAFYLLRPCNLSTHELEDPRSNRLIGSPGSAGASLAHRHTHAMKVFRRTTHRVP